MTITAKDGAALAAKATPGPDFFTPPDVIYLQAPDGEWETQHDADGVTWCAESINDSDLVYCRKGGSLGAKVLQQAALIAAQAAEIERLRGLLQDHSRFASGFGGRSAGKSARRQALEGAKP